jgi:hypothetical protein
MSLLFSAPNGHHLALGEIAAKPRFPFKQVEYLTKSEQVKCIWPDELDQVVDVEGGTMRDVMHAQAL